MSATRWCGRSRRARRGTGRSSKRRGLHQRRSTDIYQFFGATDPADLGERIRIMLDSTKLLFDPATMRNFTLSEYILKSGSWG